VSGTIAGNPNVLQEESKSYFGGLTYSPEFLPGFIIALDYYNIEIEGAIANLSTNGILANCVDGAAPDPNFCNLITRNSDGDITDFLSAPVNLGFLKNEGVDFQAVYAKDLSDIFSTANDIGNVRLSVQGTRLISSQTQTDPADETSFSENRNFVGLPELRFNFNATYNINKLSLTYALNWQNSQEVFDRRNIFPGDVIDAQSSIPEEFRKTGSFDQHDVSVRYEVTDSLTLRGGVVNIFDKDPVGYAENNIFDFFGRRYFMGANVTF
jgi:outer membrane receptor protein involved in Fe transport